MNGGRALPYSWAGGALALVLWGMGGGRRERWYRWRARVVMTLLLWVMWRTSAVRCIHCQVASVANLRSPVLVVAPCTACHTHSRPSGLLLLPQPRGAPPCSSGSHLPPVVMLQPCCAALPLHHTCSSVFITPDNGFMHCLVRDCLLITPAAASRAARMQGHPLQPAALHNLLVSGESPCQGIVNSHLRAQSCGYWNSII